jgi:hypothetical protein
VTVSYGALHKGSLQVLAYSGTDLTTPVQTVTTAAKSTAGTSETTPKATVSGSASWVVSLWQAKSSTVTAFTAPGGQAVRSTALGTGSGQIDSLATDSGGPVPAGPYGGLVAGLNSSAGSATMVTLVLAAA